MASAIRIRGKQASKHKRRASVEGAEWQGYIYQGSNANSGGIGNNYHTDCKMRTKMTDVEKKKRKAASNRKYRQENKDRLKECHRIYNQENKEKKAASNRKYHQENKDRLKECHRIYNQENKDRLKEWYRKYRQENKLKRAEYQREYNMQAREEKNFAATLQMISAVAQISELQTT